MDGSDNGVDACSVDGAGAGVDSAYVGGDEALYCACSIPGESESSYVGPEGGFGSWASVV